MPSGGNFSSCNCGPDAAACESPTQPVATVGLCLADGTPIAVTVVRDCAGAVTSEGWINLTTATWNTGAPPAGTIACGDSRSIQVSGTFCDVDPMGGVLGLVLIEYSYAADGSIAGVRLVDAVTGDTYTPSGEITTCPASVDAPERDLVQLCDTAEDGTVTSFLRDFQRDEAGLITGHADYTLDGAPYTPTGIVAPCVSECTDCQTITLCDLLDGATASTVTVTGTAAGTQHTGTLDNGVTWTSTANRATADPENWWTLAVFPAGTNGPVSVEFDHPVRAAWSARIGLAGSVSGRGIVMPEGTVAEEVHPLHAWDEATRTLSPLTGASVENADHTSRFSHPGPVTNLAFNGVTGGPPALRRIGDLEVTPLPTTFLRRVCTDCQGTHESTTDTLLDGVTPFSPAGEVGVCGPTAADDTEPCASTVTVLRLCDLNPDVPPNSEGKRCAVPFLRHLVYDCSGALTETRDTEPDGVTPYAPVEAVDCGDGGVPAMVEVPWEVVDIQPDPESAAGRGLIFSLSPIDDPETVGTVKVTTSSSYNTSSCPCVPPTYCYRNPTTYTFTPDQALRDAATYVRCDLVDFDTFEPVTGLTPPPSRLGGTAYWDGTTVRPTEDNQTGELYYDGPPDTWTYRVGNTGGGNSCSSLSFAAVSLRPEGCCAGCGGSGGDGSGRTVQEVCVIANAAPQDVMRWTRVIEDGGATIYYLDQNGDRYDSTLPAGHQIVVCPVEEPEPCRNTSTILLCDTEEEPAEPVPTEGVPTVTSLVPAAPLLPGHASLEGGGDALWSGGTLTIPPDSDASAGDGSQLYRTVTATLAAPRPACDDGTVTVTASVHVHLDGPANTGGYGGAFRLYDGAGVLVSEQGPPSSVPVGYDAVLTVTGDVPAADLAAGTVTVWLALETWQGGPKGWTADGFTVSHVFNASDEPCGEPVPVQFFRTLVTDCGTGEVVSVTDTTLDGQPYVVTGEVGQCTPAGSGEDTQPCQHCETLTLCDVQPAEPGEPDIVYEAIPLADLGPAGSYGDGSPVTGTLSNGVGYSVNVGEWGAGQGHYTFYPAVAESISPNHTWDEDSRLLCEITGQSSAVDESVFLLGPVTELPIVPSGSDTGGRGPGLIEVGVPAEQPEPGASTAFLRTVCRSCDGVLVSVTDTGLDGETPYTPTGTVTTCSGSSGSGGGGQEPAPDVELVQLCDLPADEGADPVPFLRHLVYEPGATAPTVTDTTLDGVTPYEVTGTAGVCPAEQQPCEAQSVLTECRWDDTDGDGIADAAYVELIGVSCDGTLSSLGTYREDLSEPYTPVSPVDPEEDPQDAPKATFVQAHRVELAAGASWNADSVVLLQSVTATAHGGTGQITTADGSSTLYDGESVTWSVSRDGDTALTGPLTITAGPGTVTVSYTSTTSS
ncbi:hypothetical protein HTV80_00085 [Streptomyces sp. Vc74B-19]|uniref:hypothetical protein n=1 Tax=Streptomyces sp. Vc74B-19 TaxID=2741324 RepID=UPI001BFC51DA|nr:hypothetical protein [Streptomyces sp. Vc74B-19]MBT3161512.1 hypothetical protein [Streptomyces sp. Vc74B-19]